MGGSVLEFGIGGGMGGWPRALYHNNDLLARPHVYIHPGYLYHCHIYSYFIFIDNLLIFYGHQPIFAETKYSVSFWDLDQLNISIAYSKLESYTLNAMPFQLYLTKFALK